MLVIEGENKVYAYFYGSLTVAGGRGCERFLHTRRARTMQSRSWGSCRNVGSEIV